MRKTELGRLLKIFVGRSKICQRNALEVIIKSFLRVAHINEKPWTNSYSRIFSKKTCKDSKSTFNQLANHLSVPFHSGEASTARLSRMFRQRCKDYYITRFVRMLNEKQLRTDGGRSRRARAARTCAACRRAGAPRRAGSRA